MKTYEIPLKNEKQKQYGWLCVFIIIINFAIFAYLAFAPPSALIQTTAIGACAAIIILMGIEFFLIKTRNAYQYLYKYLALTAISGAWFTIGNYWAAGIMLFVYMLFVVSQRELTVKITSSDIRYPAFPPKILSWSSLNNIIIRDGLLTIDSKNNSVIQQYIDDKKTGINEQEFNEYCRGQLNK